MTLPSSDNFNFEQELTVSVGDPTEAALVVLAAKIGVDAEITRRAHPRLAEVPFDSAYKFMATFHRASVPDDAPESVIGLVKGAPDVVLARCATAMWHDEQVPIERVHEQIVQANRSLAEQGLRVLAFAYRSTDLDHETRVQADAMAEVTDLVFVALVGIIDPLRPSAKQAVGIALDAGIDHVSDGVAAATTDTDDFDHSALAVVIH